MQRLPSRALQPGQSLFSHLPEQKLYLFQYPVVWESGNGETRFLISVLRSDEQVRNEMKTFSLQLLGWLSGICLVALLAQYYIMRWGLRPLDLLANDLKRIEAGDAERLEGRYPVEVQDVTSGLNRLLETERRQRERYRNTLGDLAHSLKTPLAVIRGAGIEPQDEQEYRQQVEEQALRMQQIVQYQLARAVKSQGQNLARAIPVQPVVERLLGVMAKVYADTPREVFKQLEPGIGFSGDERDLMELLGNLIDNAYKYGFRRVGVMGRLEGDELILEISDDGSGVAPEQRQVILERGARLDTQQPGQGIGLAVAVDIISSYDGALEVQESRWQGACFRLTLPGAPLNLKT